LASVLDTILKIAIPSQTN